MDNFDQCRTVLVKYRRSLYGWSLECTDPIILFYFKVNVTQTSTNISYMEDQYLYDFTPLRSISVFFRKYVCHGVNYYSQGTKLSMGI